MSSTTGELQAKPVGRPCATCTHPGRADIEAALLSGDLPISAISSEYAVSIAALRRHRDAHLLADEDDLRALGLEPRDLVSRLVSLRERLEDALALAETQQRVADMVRAADGIRRVERDLATITGITEDEYQNRARLGWAVTRATYRVAAKHPELAALITAQLAGDDQLALAQDLASIYSPTTASPEA